ncbi:MAG: PEP/pyruvate-binding domain-containing protein [Desulfococcaceae bacterium]
MSRIVAPDRLTSEDRARFGGKSVALSRLAAEGIPVPESRCLSADLYDAYVDATGLRDRIALILGRKSLDDMRREEVWDAALRVRHLFLTTPLPEELEAEIGAALSDVFDGRPTAVRSSARSEDGAGASFAGRHDSYVNVRGRAALLDRVRRVWASLWSDRAILYRHEMGIDDSDAAMAVLVQALVEGEVSGVAFGQSPNDPDQAVIEAVHGLNQGLVDGDVMPDRWLLDRETGVVQSHVPAKRDRTAVPAEDGVAIVDATESQRNTPPLDAAALADVFELVRRAEKIFGAPQDVEWTRSGGEIVALQSRPITRGESDSEAGGGASARMERSVSALRDLRRRVEEERLPEMAEVARELGKIDLSAMDDQALAREIRRRSEIVEKWRRVYREEFIPLAHGIRVFGQVYTDAVRPDDPFEFLDLLAGQPLRGLDRNRRLAEMAERVRERPELTEPIRSGESPLPDAELERMVADFMEIHGEASWRQGALSDRAGVGRLVVRMAARTSEGQVPANRSRPAKAEAMEREFLDRFPESRRDYAREMLDLGKASYRLRDDDNLYLGRIEGRLHRAVKEARGRLEATDRDVPPEVAPEDAARMLADADFVPEEKPAEDSGDDPRLSARQLVGQPAGPGLARGPARVIVSAAELADFQAGEVLVVDAVDPNMTFVAPLAAAVVERRGGMLIHGAIVAREYGLPCVTGVPAVARRVRTGDSLTVDGYLGIVTRHDPGERSLSE